MTMSLSVTERVAALHRLTMWTYDEDRRALYRRIAFKDFPQAIAFMVRVSFAAEMADHHPEWSNVYNRLDIWLTTHDAGDVSERDLALADQIDAIFGSYTASRS